MDFVCAKRFNYRKKYVLKRKSVSFERRQATHYRRHVGDRAPKLLRHSVRVTHKQNTFHSFSFGLKVMETSWSICKATVVRWRESQACIGSLEDFSPKTNSQLQKIRKHSFHDKVLRVIHSLSPVSKYLPYTRKQCVFWENLNEMFQLEWQSANHIISHFHILNTKRSDECLLREKGMRAEENVSLQNGRMHSPDTCSLLCMYAFRCLLCISEENSLRHFSHSENYRNETIAKCNASK